MIIGNGLLASCFKKNIKEFHPNVTIFASGVSNSKELKDSEFNREIDLLSKYLNSPRYIVYFSTCSIYDESLISTPYVQHKLKIEDMLQARGNSLIIRLPQIIGSGVNSNNLLNCLYKKISSGEIFDVWVGAKRSLIDVEDVVFFTQKLIAHYMPSSSLINLAAPTNISIIELVKLIEKYSGFSAQYNLINLGSSYSIDIKLLYSLFDEYCVIFDQKYFESIILKYCKATEKGIF